MLGASSANLTSNLSGNDYDYFDYSLIVDFSENECFFIYCAFILGAIVGTTVNLMVVVVLFHKLYSTYPRSASDILISFLTSIDLLACSCLFPMEALNYRKDKCNLDPSLLAFGFTFCLEVASTIAMLSIAINRYILICQIGRCDFNSRAATRTCTMNVIISVSCTLFVINFTEVAMPAYICTIMLILISMVILYFLSIQQLRKRALVARKRSQWRTQHQFSSPRSPMSTMLSSTASSFNLKSGTGNKSKDEHHNNDLELPTQSQLRPRGSIDVAEGAKTQMEQMMNRSAKIFAIITIVYIVCFLPNAILTAYYFFIGQDFLTTPQPFVLEVVIRYANLIYNINFLLMPGLYAKLSPQFLRDCQSFRKSFRKNPQQQDYEKRMSRDEGTHVHKSIIESRV